jgi:D-alanyl-lipoteichoic acid acyltransferase DltB (MBOAT superfamily)
MLFNSYEFILLFLPITLSIYFYINSKKLLNLSKAFLVFSSLFFYSWWSINYLPIILFSIIFNYIIGNLLINGSKKILVFGIVTNIALLIYFKYADFLISNFNNALNMSSPLLNLTLPLAISFFTFQQISYLVDSYKNETKEYDFLNYALFVTFFPQLIAGPIVHHKEMMPQFFRLKNRFINYKNISMGVFIFSIGLFKKVIIADTFAVWATMGFDNAIELNLFEAWATSLSYTFQIYFDFSGYTDMAIGLALLFNIRLPINFNSPYKAKNIQDFWKRWHITLSRFLRDYIYIPLGGNRRGKVRVYTNLLITFLIGGIWHGAGWTFLFWGFLHGMGVVIYRVWNRFNLKLYKPLAWFITFIFINITWVFFRAESWSSGVKVLGSMFSLDNIILPRMLESKLLFLKDYGVEFAKFTPNIGAGFEIIFWLFGGFTLVLLFQNSIEKLYSFKLNYKTAIFTAIISTIGILSLNRVSEFLYFNF